MERDDIQDEDEEMKRTKKKQRTIYSSSPINDIYPLHTDEKNTNEQKHKKMKDKKEKKENKEMKDMKEKETRRKSNPEILEKDSQQSQLPSQSMTKYSLQPSQSMTKYS